MDVLNINKNKYNLKNFKILENIGKGSFSSVYKVQSTDGEALACKKISNNEPEIEKKIIQEIEILEIMSSHPNSMKFYGYEKPQKNEIVIFFELLNKDFKSLHSQKNSIFEENFEIYFQQLIFFFSYMQKKGILHRDIKPSNISLDFKGRIKVFDFGVSEIISRIEDTIPIAGTLNYLSPELYEAYRSKKDCINLKQKIDKNMTIRTSHRIKCSKVFKSDVFSLGLTLLYLLNFYPKNKRDEKINSNFFQTFLDSSLKAFIEKKDKIDVRYKQLIGKMLEILPENRPDMIEIEDYLLYSFYCPLDHYFPFELNSFLEDTFINDKAFPKISNDVDFEKNNLIFFQEELVRAIKIPESFLSIFKEHKSINLDSILQEINQPDMKKEDFLRIQELLTDNFKEKIIFESLIYVYTMECNFYKNINRSLMKNSEISYFNFLNAIFKTKTSSKYQVTNSIVFRSLCIPKNNDYDSMTTRCEYVVGIHYYWPAFTSTSKEESNSIENFLQKKANKDTYNFFLFKINLNLANKNNKFDVSKISLFKKENEILILPYFGFKVLQNKPIKIGDINVCAIEISENSEYDCPKQIIWFDPEIDNKENKKYLDTIKKNLGISTILTFKALKEAYEFIKITKEFDFLVISCGSKGKEFFDLIKEEKHVKNLIVFCFDVEKHRKWFNKEKYEKYAGIFKQYRSFECYLPYYAYD